MLLALPKLKSYDIFGHTNNFLHFMNKYKIILLVGSYSMKVDQLVMSSNVP